MNPSHRLVKLDRTAGFGSGNSGGANGVIGGDAVKVARQRAQSHVQIAGGGALLLPPALREVATVAIKGMVVIRPIR